MPFDAKSIQTFSPDKENLWEIRFDEAPAPFNALIPAVDVSLNVWSLDTLEHAYGNTTIKVPLGTSAFPLSITFYDSEDLILSNWFEVWVNNTILSRPGCVLPLSTSHRRVEVRKLNRQHEIVKQWKLLVIPDGSSDFTGNTGSSELRQIVHQFVIVGTYSNAEVSTLLNTYNPLQHLDQATSGQTAESYKQQFASGEGFTEQEVQEIARQSHNGREVDYQANRTWTSTITDRIPATIRPYLGF